LYLFIDVKNVSGYSSTAKNCMLLTPLEHETAHLRTAAEMRFNFATKSVDRETVVELFLIHSPWKKDQLSGQPSSEPMARLMVDGKQ
jgi:hypothetical protein